MPPTYEVECFKCGFLGERISKVAERHSLVCDCGSELELLISTPSSGRTNMAFSSQAILGDGSKIKGNFGRARKHRPGGL